MGRRAIPKTTAFTRKATADEAALGSAMARVERFVETLRDRCEAAGARVEAAAAGTRSAARAQRELEEIWADYEAAQRLRNTVGAAVASAQAKVAVIEADACAAVAAAFTRFKEDRKWTRRAAIKRAAKRRSLRAAARPKSPDELAEMVAVAKEAVVHVLIDRNQLTHRLVDTRAAAAELRARLTSAAAEELPECALIRQRIELCEGHVTYLEQQLLASATAAQQLLLGLRELTQGLPEPVVSALPRVEARRGFGRDERDEK
ncbi:hypothetical protein WMF30_12325 [Sorangium sp. So ce134]